MGGLEVEKVEEVGKVEKGVDKVLTGAWECERMAV